MKPHSLNDFSIESKIKILLGRNTGVYYPSNHNCGIKEDGEIIYACIGCGSTFRSSHSLEMHIMAPIYLITLNCYYCKKKMKFFNRCELVHHMQMHGNYTIITLNNITVGPLELKFMRSFAQERLNIDDCKYIYRKLLPNDSVRNRLLIRYFHILNEHLFKEKGFIAVLPTIIDEKAKIRKYPARTKNNVIIPVLFPALRSSYMMPDKNLFEIDNIGVDLKVYEGALPNMNLELKPPRVHTCHECKEIVTNMRKHIARDDKIIDPALRCNVCELICVTRCQLEAHTRIHFAQAPYVCPDCGGRFDSYSEMGFHLDWSCLHKYKVLKIMCPAQSCNKEYSLKKNLNLHVFYQHVQKIFSCLTCNVCLLNEEHVTSEKCNIEEQYWCGICNVMFKEFLEHMKIHQIKYMFGYSCCFCKKQFRTREKFAKHFICCPKSNQYKPRCRFCDMFLFGTTYPTCGSCAFRLDKRNLYIVSPVSESNWMQGDYIIFKLKNVDLTDETVINLSQTIVISDDETDNISTDTTLALDIIKTEKINSEDITENASGLNSDSTNILDNIKIEEPSREDMTEDISGINDCTTQIVDNVKIENTSREDSTELDLCDSEMNETEKDIEGLFICAVCNFKDCNKDKFFNHIVSHRIDSTHYQCMECGLCFAVKPSLGKHLAALHDILDSEEYINSHNCFDEKAVNALRMSYLNPTVQNDSVSKNQCKVCMKIFDSEVELQCHRRVHGMYFITSTQLNKTSS